MTAGVEFIDNVHQDQQASYSDSAGSGFVDNGSSTQHAVYAQDEIKLTRWLILNAGLRYDGYRAVQPGDAARGRHRHAVAQSVVQVSVRIRVSRAERVRAERASTSDVANLRPESIDTHELVWERYTNDWLRTSVSTYWYKADSLITLTPDPSAPLGITVRQRRRRCAPRGWSSKRRCGSEAVCEAK